MNDQVRVRFAPSPTGALHIGGVRTALFNYLFAKKNGGEFILRIEDTDQKRFVEGAEEYIRNSLAWLGIDFDEGAEIGGDFGPYRQSLRKDIYKKYVDQLLAEGNAYYAFDTPEELEAMRTRLMEAKVDNPQYNAITRGTMKNSLTLSPDEVQQRIDAGEPYTIRLKVPIKEEVRINDMIRGWVVIHSSALDDKIIMKADGMPTYHLANVVDDHLMKITHVIRGEEWLPSAPLHVLLYRFLGWEAEIPTFAHVPLLLKPSGNGKLSKRDGDKFGFPVFPIEGNFPDKKGAPELYRGFREDGYFPEALINFMVLLGWNPGTEQELFSLEELIAAFEVERINKAGAKFDIEKAQWFNQQYLKSKENKELATELKSSLDAQSITYNESVLEDIVALMKERVTFVKDIPEAGKFLFASPEAYDEKVIRKRWTEQANIAIRGFGEKVPAIEPFIAENIHDTFVAHLETLEIPMGKVMQAFRVAITGVGSGPDLMKIMEVIGKDEVSARISKSLDILKEQIKVNS